MSAATIVDACETASAPAGAPGGPDGDEGVRDFTAALPSIGLDDLIGRAALLTRVDRKYLLAPELLTELVNSLADDADSASRVLELNGLRAFRYQSVYFDTPELMSLKTAGQKRRRRAKIRTRRYLESGQTWLEVKLRGTRGTSVKQRVELPETAELTELGEFGERFVAEVLRSNEVPGLEANRLTPVVQTSYRRTTMHHRERERGLECRVTIDTDLGFAPPYSTEWELRRGAAVVEVKAGPNTMPVERFLWQLGSRPLVTSKYGVGMALVQPDAPHLKWHRAVEKFNRAQ